MKVSIGIGGAASGRKRDFDEQVDYVVEAEKQLLTKRCSYLRLKRLRASCGGLSSCLD
jgi:hypothetical protein